VIRDLLNINIIYKSSDLINREDMDFFIHKLYWHSAIKNFILSHYYRFIYC